MIAGPSCNDEQVDEYWNHNAAYHPRIVDVARRRGGSALDVGCGEGLLVQRLAPVCHSVTGIDPDERALTLARVRTAGRPNVSLRAIDFLSMDHAEKDFDLITFVATLHQLETAAALTQARDLLRPGGALIVVGLSVNRTARDWFISASLLPVIRSIDLVRRHGGNPGVVIIDPTEHLSEIRSTADAVIPGATIRRGLYYRYVLQWSKPSTDRTGARSEWL